jgi:hypothetical protein
VALRSIAGIEATQLGLDIRVVVTNSRTARRSGSMTDSIARVEERH